MVDVIKGIRNLVIQKSDGSLKPIVKKWMQRSILIGVAGIGVGVILAVFSRDLIPNFQFTSQIKNPAFGIAIGIGTISSTVLITNGFLIYIGRSARQKIELQKFLAIDANEDHFVSPITQEIHNQIKQKAIKYCSELFDQSAIASGTFFILNQISIPFENGAKIRHPHCKLVNDRIVYYLGGPSPKSLGSDVESYGSFVYHHSDT